ncbi:MAG: type II toxin-antitoxin system VapC family toxin [Terracidiphilus sp.]|jgi:predicted nucleic acid-binding protein
MSEFAIFDTSVLVDQLRTNRHLSRIVSLDVPIKNSSVVIAELRRGAVEPKEARLVSEMARNHALLTPTTNNWLESGQVLAQIRDDMGFEPQKLRDLHFDVLIALTVRSHGARLITSNRADFELIRGYRDFKLEVW